MKRSALLLCSLLVSGPAAAEVISLSGPAKGLTANRAQQLVLQHAERLGAPGAAVRLKRVDTVPDGRAWRFEQVHGSLPVLDGGATLVVINQRLVALTGALFKTGSFVAPDRRLDRAAASQALVAALPGSRVRHASRAVLAGPAARRAREVWVLDVIRSNPFGLFEVRLDAGSGKILASRSTMSHVKGQVYSTNPVVGKLVTEDLPRLDKKTALTGTYAHVQRCNIKNQTEVKCDNLAKPNDKGDFIYKPKEPSISDPFAEVQGYYHVDRFHNWLSSSFGFKRPGTTQQIDVVVNFHVLNSSGKPQGYPNAFFGDLNGDKKGDLVMGQSSRDFVYDADVVYHEFGHSAVDETSNLSMTMDNLGANVTPMALNEAFADLMSSAFTNDSVVGDYSKPGGIRTLTGVASCPKHISGESHQDGLIWGRAVWTARSKLKDTKVFDEVLYTVLSTLNKNASFKDAEKLFRTVAKAKDATVEAAAAAEFKARGLPTCERFIPLTENLTRQGYIYGVRMAPGMQVFPFGYQFKIEVPKDTEELTIFLRGYGWGGNGAIAGYIRAGKPVEYSYSGSTYDLIKSNTTNTIVIDKDSKAPLQPGTTYYVLPLNAGKQTTVFMISYKAKIKGPPQPDMPITPDMGAPDQAPIMADTARADTGEDPSLANRTGCSCRVDGGASAPLLSLALALVALAWWRRKKG